MVFKYQDSWQECDESEGTLENKKFVTTLQLYMHEDGTTNSGVQWHRGGWHGAWQWVLPEQRLQIRFCHSGSENNIFLHSFERQAPAGFSRNAIDNNLFRCNRDWCSTSKYTSWTTTIELCETWLVEDAGWSLVASSGQCHPLFSFGSQEHYVEPYTSCEQDSVEHETAVYTDRDTCWTCDSNGWANSNQDDSNEAVKQSTETLRETVYRQQDQIYEIGERISECVTEIKLLRKLIHDVLQAHQSRTRRKCGKRDHCTGTLHTFWNTELDNDNKSRPMMLPRARPVQRWYD